MRSSLASLVAMAALALPGSQVRHLVMDESTRVRRYCPATGRSITAAAQRILNRHIYLNEHGQPYGQSGNKLARKASRGRLGMATLR